MRPRKHGSHLRLSWRARPEAEHHLLCWQEVRSSSALQLDWESRFRLRPRVAELVAKRPSFPVRRCQTAVLTQEFRWAQAALFRRCRSKNPALRHRSTNLQASWQPLARPAEPESRLCYPPAISAPPYLKQNGRVDP